MAINELKKCGHPTQLYAVEELKLVGGKANEMRLINMRNGKGLNATFAADRDTLDLFTEWKSFQYRDYALGYEPANAKVEDRKKLRDEGLLKFIAPDEVVNFKLKFTILDGDEGLKTVRDRMDYLLK